MGTLKKSDNTTIQRQEIGRGLRLSVDQHGERMDNPVTVHDINELTVVTDESYTQFVTALQKEIVESLSTRPRKATPDFFIGRLVTAEAEVPVHEITQDDAKQLLHWLTVSGFIDYDQHLTDKWHGRAELPEIPELPAGLQQCFYQVDRDHRLAPRRCASAGRWA